MIQTPGAQNKENKVTVKFMLRALCQSELKWPFISQDPGKPAF